MSVFKPKNAIASTKFDGFGGIDAKAPPSDVSSAYDVVNFRVLDDGSLEKRQGFSPIAICNENIRAVWSGKLEGESLTFIVHGNTVSTVDTSSSTLKTVGTIQTSLGAANFIFFDGILFLMDGKGFYAIDKTSVSTFEGYAPLFADCWPSAAIGPINEPINLTTRHIRMTYSVTESLIYLRVVHVISSIDAVYLNGTLITDTSEYYYDRELMCVCVLGLKAGDYVELYLTIASSELDNSALLSCKHSVVYGGYTDSRLFLWGGDIKNVMYASSSIDDASLAASKRVYGDTIPLYIPPNAAFTMGREGRKIKAVCRQYDRLLIFTDGETWTAFTPEGDGKPLDAITVNSSRGCASDGAALLCENDPVCVSSDTILRWSAESDELNECNAYSISTEIDSRLTQSFFNNAIILLDSPRHELIFSDKTDSSGSLWIYNYKSKKWYRFSDIGAENLFICDNTLGFTRDKTVYLFNLTGHDVLSDGTERSIEAYFESHPTDLSILGSKKRLCGVTLSAKLSDGEICARLISDGKTIASQIFKSESDFIKGHLKRLTSQRFDYVTLRLHSSADSDQRIYSAGIFAKR